MCASDGRRFTQKCARQSVVIVAATCVLETSLLLICAFSSTCEFLTCRALSVPDPSSPVEGPQQPCPHTLDELPSSYCNTPPPFSSFCLDTVAKATTYDRFLFGIIYQWLAVSRHQSAAISVRTRSSPAVPMPSPPSYHVINRRLL